MNSLNKNYKQQVHNLSQFMKSECPDMMDACPLTHHFADGVYTRELFIPAGLVVVGAIHRFAVTNILLQGSGRLVTDACTVEVKAPHISVTPRHTQKIFFASEDSIFVNVLPWDGKMSVEEIERWATMSLEDLKMLEEK